MNEPIIHLAVDPFVAACGADEPNQATTTVRENVTCPCCLGNHHWVSHRISTPDALEWITECVECGAEKTED